MATAPAPSQASPIEPGTTVGGRFVVEAVATEDALGHVLAAKDAKTGKPISLRLLSHQVVGGAEQARALREECRAVAGMTHRHLLATYGVGKASTGQYFVAGEWAQGSPLSAILAQRAAEGRHISLKGAHALLAQVAEALTKIHEKSAHGALRPSVVWVDATGHAKLGDAGVARGVISAGGPTALGPQEQACLAPEVKAGAAPDRAADVFGLGALLYAMLTGRSPAEGFVPPSQVHPEATAAIDEVLLTCLAPSPDERFESPQEVASVLAPLVAHGATVAPDVDFATGAAAAPAPATPAPNAPPQRDAVPDAPGDRPQVGARVSVHEAFRPSLAETPAAPPQAAEVDLGSLLTKITENDAPRWMVVKDRLDHGPFSGRELVELIAKGEALGTHRLLNMDTGERRRVAEWPDFAEFVQQYEIKKRAQDHRNQLVASERAETRSNVFKIGVAAALVGVLMIGGLGFLLTREAASEEEVAEADLANLYERGEVEITGTAGVLPEPTGRRRGGKRRGGSGGSGMSYEDAMNQAMEMGDVNQGGGEQQLSPNVVASVMNKHINKFFTCVSQELRSGGQLGKVQIDLAIAGSGQVLGASVRPGSPTFQSCVTAKARSVQFPSFSAPRMGARYSFSVD
jgi:eukaryotic-like serine/threonine-protein kinase